MRERGAFTLTTTQAQLDAELHDVTPPAATENCTGTQKYSDVSAFRIIERANFTLRDAAGTIQSLSVQLAGVTVDGVIPPVCST